MYCINCGALNMDNAYKCTECGTELFHPAEEAQVEKIPNYLVQSILITLCCCLPLGIVAIINAAQVNGKLASGDIRGAQVASDNAKKWCWWGFGLGLIANILYAILQGMAEIGAQ